MYFFCISCFVILLVPRYDKPKYRPLRGIIFVVCGVLSVIPIYHIEFLTHQKYIHDFHTFPWFLGGVIYIVGAITYMLKIPERFNPGYFDIFVFTILITCIGMLSLTIPFHDCDCCFNSLLGKHLSIP